MRLTDKHISDEDLSHLIWLIEKVGWVYVAAHIFDIVFPAILELKQRRAEDRQREAENGGCSD